MRAFIKVEFANGVRLGPGKVRLLELVEETGSISAAARHMEMSYRRAWLLIDELNEALQMPVVETAAGGKGGGGAKVTAHGQQLIDQFHALQAEADALVAAKFGGLPS